MMIPGEIEKRGSLFAARLEPIGAYAQGKTREAACAALASTILEHAADYGPLEGLKVNVADDGDATLYITSNDPTRLIALLLRRQREFQDMSLADVTSAMGAKSRNGWAQYEQGRTDPSISKLQEMLAVVAPELTIAIIPRTASVIPRWNKADVDAEIDKLLEDPSPANVAALRAKHAPAKRKTKVAR